MIREMPSLDLGAPGIKAPAEQEYPLHDRDHFVEFVLGMWFHTCDLVGWPTLREVQEQLRDLPRTRRERLASHLARAARSKP
jgi:hypothetical protein